MPGVVSIVGASAINGVEASVMREDIVNPVCALSNIGAAE
jgi:hypothetical protein